MVAVVVFAVIAVAVVATIMSVDRVCIVTPP